MDPTRRLRRAFGHESLGGKRVSVGQDESVSWVVMADPEGNEFCVLRAFTPEELASF
ncbi:VOC family protein [Kribbella qitaiheensis]|uniref:VOC family protein n=1 Tax=Kribbella qitaiheensis TaxID=1544730 RepID=UPI001FE7F881|nr:VOC family protein [Kribbella qitaiheensis]